MRKNLKLFAVCALMLFTFTLPAFALGEGGERVFDYADLLTPEQEAHLQTEIENLVSNGDIDFDVVILTTNDTEGKTTREYADDFFDYNAFGIGSNNNGALLLVDMNARTVYISTTGSAIDYLTDARIELALDDIFLYLPDGDYFNSALSFLRSCASFTAKGVPEGQYQYDEETGQVVARYKSLTTDEIIFALVIGCIGGGIALLIVLARYRGKVRGATYPLSERGRLTLHRQNDVFMGRHVRQRHIPPPSSNTGGGGGSSVHMGSSGTSHGGGGRSF